MADTAVDQAILTAIPHRPPFLFIDQVVELDDDRALTTKLADPEAAFFKGHYPGQPLMPGVLICEAVFQTGALLLAHRVGGTTGTPKVPVLTRIGEAKFKNIVLPGQTLNIEVTFDEELGDAFFLTGRVSVEGKPVLRVKFACMLSEPRGPEA